MYVEIDSPSVSVIVPVYNGQKTIERCIDSILNQGFQDWELIIINDGSSDNTINILKRYVEMDDRIILVTQKNAGVSAARNAGINQASGKWITFVDADDYLEQDCLETVFSNDDLNKYDLVFWNYYRVNLYKKETPVIFQQPKGEYVIEELFPYIFYNSGKQCLSSVYCRLFRRELILKKQIYFHESVVMYEDKIFMIDYLMCTEKSLGLTKHLYNRTLNIDSAMHCWHWNAKEEYFLAAKLLKDKLLYNGMWNLCCNTFHIWIFQECVTQYLETYICHMQNIADKETRKRELYMFISENIIAESLKQIKVRDLSIKSRIKFIVVKCGWIGILDKWYRNKTYFA